MKATKSTTIHEVLEFDESVAPVLMGFGLHCLGCPGARGETIEHAALKHGVDPEEMLNAINEHFETNA